MVACIKIPIDKLVAESADVHPLLDIPTYLLRGVIYYYSIAGPRLKL